MGSTRRTEMLATAANKVRRRGLENRITLRTCYAEELDHARTFGLEAPFDAAFFSYSLSMIPTWPQAIAAALANVKPRRDALRRRFLGPGRLATTGFAPCLRPGSIYSTSSIGRSCSNICASWRHGAWAVLTLEPVAGRYAYLATFRKLS